jgi:hypothetical protein
MNPSENFEYLLNGLLDGVLTDEEQQLMDRALREDPSLEVRLSELQALRNSLLRGRSVGRLGPEFAKQVVEASRKRAEMMGDRAPAWLRPPVQRSADRVAKRVPPPSEPRVRLTLSPDSLDPDPESLPQDVSFSHRAWRVWIPVLAAAVLGSITLYFAGSVLVPRPVAEPLALVPKAPVPSEENERSANARAAEMLANRDPSESDSRDIDPDKSSSPDNRSESVSGSAQIAAADPNEKTDNMTVDRRLADTDRSPSDGRAVEDAPLPPAVQKMLDSKGILADDAVFTLVAEVGVDAIAQRDDALKSLMDEYEIVYTDDANLDQQQMDSLIASQMVGMLAGVDIPKRSDGVQVVFVRAKATKIDAFLTAVQSQYEAFPRFHLDMSFDPSVKTLIEQLRSIVTTDDSARRLTFHGKDRLGLVTAFPASDREVDYLDVEVRKRLAGQAANPSLKGLSNMNAYLILLVRALPENGQ